MLKGKIVVPSHDIRAKYGVNGNITFKMFKKDFKSFTAKYSEVTMQDKKALYEKLSKFEKEIYNLGNKCSTVTRKDVYIMKENAIKTGKTQLNDTISTIIEWGGLSYRRSQWSIRRYSLY